MKAETTHRLPDLDALENALVRRWDVLLAAAFNRRCEYAEYRLVAEALLETSRELAAVRMLRRVAPRRPQQAA